MAPMGAPLRLTLAGDPPYGLIQSARVLADGTDTIPATERPGDLGDAMQPADQSEASYRWTAGFTIEPDPCGGGAVIDPCGSDYLDDTHGTADAQIGPVQPLPAIATVRCSTFGTQYETRRERALRKLRGSRSYQLEREFWTGLGALAAGYTDNQYLTKAGSTIVNSGAAMGSQTALAELEQAIADASSWARGMIHAQPRTVSYWMADGLVERRGNILVTALDTIVVPGRGYPGTGPGDTDLTTGLGGDASWAYATSLVYVMIGAPRVLADRIDAPGLTPAGVSADPSTNTLTVTAEQPVAAAWDGCVHAAALVLHTSERTATGS